MVLHSCTVIPYSNIMNGLPMNNQSSLVSLVWMLFIIFFFFSDFGAKIIQSGGRWKLFLKGLILVGKVSSISVGLIMKICKLRPEKSCLTLAPGLRRDVPRGHQLREEGAATARPTNGRVGRRNRTGENGKKPQVWRVIYFWPTAVAEW